MSNFFLSILVSKNETEYGTRKQNDFSLDHWNGNPAEGLASAPSS
jgi:hypothetical protein